MAKFVNIGDPQIDLLTISTEWLIWQQLPKDIAPTFDQYLSNEFLFEWEVTGRCREVFEDGVREDEDHEEVEVRVLWSGREEISRWRSKPITYQHLVWIPKFLFGRIPVRTYGEPKDCTLFE